MLIVSVHIAIDCHWLLKISRLGRRESHADFPLHIAGYVLQPILIIVTHPILEADMKGVIIGVSSGSSWSRSSGIYGNKVLRKFCMTAKERKLVEAIVQQSTIPQTRSVISGVDQSVLT